MEKKGEVVNNTDVDDDNSIKSDDDNVMDNLKDLVSNLTKKDKKKKSKKKEEEEIVIDEDDSEEDDYDEDNSEEDDTEEDDSDDDTYDSEDEEDDALFNNNIMALASLFQESFYDSEGVSVGESLSKIANLMEKFYNLEKKKYQKAQ
ncbi:hypothetical protein OAH43_00300 [bacterium]|nr:hypothetical protein [bacterium]